MARLLLIAFALVCMLVACGIGVGNPDKRESSTLITADAAKGAPANGTSQTNPLDDANQEADLSGNDIAEPPTNAENNEVTTGNSNFIPSAIALPSAPAQEASGEATSGSPAPQAPATTNSQQTDGRNDHNMKPERPASDFSSLRLAFSETQGTYERAIKTLAEGKLPDPVDVRIEDFANAVETPACEGSRRGTVAVDFASSPFAKGEYFLRLCATGGFFDYLDVSFAAHKGQYLGSVSDGTSPQPPAAEGAQSTMNTSTWLFHVAASLESPEIQEAMGNVRFKEAQERALFPAMAKPVRLPTERTFALQLLLARFAELLLKEERQEVLGEITALVDIAEELLPSPLGAMEKTALQAIKNAENILLSQKDTQ